MKVTRRNSKDNLTVQEIIKKEESKEAAKLEEIQEVSKVHTLDSPAVLTQKWFSEQTPGTRRELKTC
jgi:hypothetical protein